ncbi:hypothetical protein V1511DRAFT_498609 [Dipodascopsis uninucleata]
MVFKRMRKSFKRLSKSSKKSDMLMPDDKDITKGNNGSISHDTSKAGEHNDLNDLDEASKLPRRPQGSPTSGIIEQAGLDPAEKDLSDKNSTGENIVTKAEENISRIIAESTAAVITEEEKAASTDSSSSLSPSDLDLIVLRKGIVPSDFYQPKIVFPVLFVGILTFLGIVCSAVYLSVILEQHMHVPMVRFYNDQVSTMKTFMDHCGIDFISSSLFCLTFYGTLLALALVAHREVLGSVKVSSATSGVDTAQIADINEINFMNGLKFGSG